MSTSATVKLPDVFVRVLDITELNSVIVSIHSLHKQKVCVTVIATCCLSTKISWAQRLECFLNVVFKLLYFLECSSDVTLIKFLESPQTPKLWLCVGEEPSNPLCPQVPGESTHWHTCKSSCTHTHTHAHGERTDRTQWSHSESKRKVTQ